MRICTICRFILSIALIAAIAVCAAGIYAVESPKKIRVLYTDNTMGYWRPCGCDGKPVGGLARRATAISQYVKENPNTVIVDSGNISDSPAKLDLILSLMSDFKYDAVGLGQSDIAMGTALYEKAEKNKLAVLDISSDAHKSTVPYIVKNVDGVRVGVISFGAVATDAKISEFDLRKSRLESYKQVRSKCDVLVVLDQADIVTDDWIQRNAARFGAPDIVIPGQSRNTGKEVVVGSTHIMPRHFQAKQLGVVDIEYTPGMALNISMSNVALDKNFPEDQIVAAKIAEGILATYVRPRSSTDKESGDSPNSRPYYSTLLCKACHQKQYKDWVTTKHAIALKTLIERKSTTADCLPCHSEQYRATDTYMVTQSAHAGVECATCHSASLPHGLERKMRTVRTKVDPNVCVNCHTKDRSPDYDEKTYLSKVAHSITPSTTTASKSDISR